MTKLDLLKEKIEIANKNFVNCFLNRIIEITNKDFSFVFSKNKNLSLLFSLNTQNPFFEVTSSKEKDSLNSLFLNQLKSKIMNSLFKGASFYNDDSIISFNFLKTTDTYEKKNYVLLFEVFKGNPNLILLENNIILLAYRYHSLETKHPIVIDTNYLPMSNVFIYKNINLEEENKKINDYINNISSSHLKEKYNYLFLKLKRKKKTLENKLNTLKKEKEEATLKLKYKDYADYFLMNMDNISKGDKYFIYNDKKIPLKENYSKTDNLAYLYKVYKKAKGTLLNCDNFIQNTLEELSYIDNILSQKEFYNDIDYQELLEEIKAKNIIQLPKTKDKEKTNKAYSPYFFTYKNYKIGFGKTSLQNNELTFVKARKNDYYLHIKDYHGSHVVIFNPNNEELSDEILLLGLETVLCLSKKEKIEVYVAKIKDVKKGKTLGLVNLLKYESYVIDKYSENTKKLIENASRF